MHRPSIGLAHLSRIYNYFPIRVSRTSPFKLHVYSVFGGLYVLKSLFFQALFFKRSITIGLLDCGYSVGTGGTVQMDLLVGA